MKTTIIPAILLFIIISFSTASAQVTTNCFGYPIAFDSIKTSNMLVLFEPTYVKKEYATVRKVNNSKAPSTNQAKFSSSKDKAQIIIEFDEHSPMTEINIGELPEFGGLFLYIHYKGYEIANFVKSNTSMTLDFTSIGFYSVASEPYK